jgi:hypothetical protein
MAFHSYSKFRVSATEAFRKTTFTEVSSSKILSETSGFRIRTETSGFLTETSDFRTENSFALPETTCFWKPVFRVFQPKLFVLQRIVFVLPKLWVFLWGFFATETSEYQIQTKFLNKTNFMSHHREQLYNYLTIYTNSGLSLLSWSSYVDSALQIVPNPTIFSLFVIQSWRCLTETVNLLSLSTTIRNTCSRTEITGRTVVTVNPQSGELRHVFSFLICSRCGPHQR